MSVKGQATCEVLQDLLARLIQIDTNKSRAAEFETADHALNDLIVALARGNWQEIEAARLVGLERCRAIATILREWPSELAKAIEGEQS